MFNSEQEVRAWAKVNGYSGDAVEKLVSDWKKSLEPKVEVPTTVKRSKYVSTSEE